MSLSQTDVRRGELRGGGAQTTNTPQNLMVFVLSMALFGLSNIILEVIPDITIGPVDFSVSYFVFVPITLAALVSPFWVALGAPLGEIIFTDLLMGDFSGLAEVEGFIQMFLAIYIAGSVIRNPLSRGQIVLGSLLVVGIDKFLSAAVDLAKVWVGVEDAEFVQGLPESVLLLEGIGFVVDLLMSGVLFGAIPALWLIPALYRRIEPMLGLQPREPGRRIPGSVPRAGWFVAVAILAGIGSFFFAFLEAWDVEVGSVEGDFREQFGDGFLWVSVGAIVVVLIIASILFAVWRKRRGARER
ncbi:cell division protein FtsQ [Microbacterium halophytorum]|uniref:cell division protein FtsQ n=1 Tax=Microbacterium halophytorum TaxID=2067568 RepID=UPI000CFD3FBD|nr:cell division protein FtsQ [Microbacterium halophytorum]